MLIALHDHGAPGSGRQLVAGMTVVLGESLFSDDFYCPLYPAFTGLCSGAGRNMAHGGADGPADPSCSCAGLSSGIIYHPGPRVIHRLQDLGEGVEGGG